MISFAAPSDNELRNSLSSHERLLSDQLLSATFDLVQGVEREAKTRISMEDALLFLVGVCVIELEETAHDLIEEHK